MNKILFVTDQEKIQILNELNESLETKNRLLKLIITNPDKKTSTTTRRKKQTRYEEQITLLEGIKSLLQSCKSREDVQKLNKMIDYFNTI